MYAARFISMYIKFKNNKKKNQFESKHRDIILKLFSNDDIGELKFQKY